MGCVADGAGRCTGCGLTVPGGTEGCRERFEALHARAYDWGVPYALHRLAVDTYTLQHPDRYCVSAKSLAAHLTGLCWALEHGGHPAGLRALQRWLNGTPALTKPPLPATHGALTVAEVCSASDADAYAHAVERWARATWQAYAALHPLARRWVAAALARR